MRSVITILITALATAGLAQAQAVAASPAASPALAQVTGRVPAVEQPLDQEPAEQADTQASQESSPLGAMSAPPLGSRARQLTLKFRLLRESAGTELASALDHNRQEWELLSPDQRDQFRRTAVAFLQKNPAQQDKLLEHYAQFIEMSEQKREAYQRRAQWLQAVVATLTPEQREQLERLPLAQRAQRLVALRDQLVREGKLVLDAQQPEQPEPDAPEPDATQP